MIKPTLEKLISDTFKKYRDVVLITKQQMLKGLMDQATKMNNICFTELPVRHIAWPEQIWKLWCTEFAGKVKNGQDRYFVQTNYICNVIKGTTFSGHPTKTTLGNTIRSLAYAYYYCLKAGITRPWDSEFVDVMAAGDDVVIFVHPDWVERISSSVL